MTPTPNRELVKEYIKKGYSFMNITNHFEILKEIQSKLIEPMEYKIGQQYEFSDDGENWTKYEFMGYSDGDVEWNHIRPIQIPPEIRSAISLLEKSGYTVTN